MTLHIFFFGKFRVQYRERLLTGLKAHTVQRLFAYLLLHRDRPHPRETLADLLWDNPPTAQPKKCLRQTLWQLQTTLEAQLEGFKEPVLLVEPDWIQINPKTDIWFDVAVFEQTFDLVRGIPGRELDNEQAQMLQSAVQLYQGDLLEGCYEDWCLYERERLQNMYLAILEKLMAYCAERHEYELGQAYGLAALRYDPTRERAHRRLMRLYFQGGNRTGALHQYKRCLLTLAKELGVKPAKSTVALYEQIRADWPVELSSTLVEVSLASPTPSTLLPEILDHLKRLQVTLVDLQRQVTQDIQAIEEALNDQR